MKRHIHKSVATRLSETNQLLVKTALLSGSAAREAGVAWLNSVDIEAPHEGSRRLFSLAYDNLRRENVDHPLMPILKGSKRYNWYKNRLLFRAVDPVITALKRAGVEVILLKGAALVSLYYRDYALRAMKDVDLLVPFDKAVAATNLLVSLGWYPKIPITALESQLRYDNARSFYDQNRQNIDLHWHMLPSCVGPHSDDSFWEASREIPFESNQVRVLHPADQFLHACAHGAEWGRPASVEWIADAIFMLRETPNFDWDRLQAQARMRELTVCLREALYYLHDTLDAPVPAEVMNSLAVARVSDDETQRYVDVINYEPGHGPLATFGELLRRYDRISRCFGHHEGASYLDYLRSRAKVDGTWELPFAVAQKVTQRIVTRVKESLQPDEPDRI
jgi:hypothetical protein